MRLTLARERPLARALPVFFAAAVALLLVPAAWLTRVRRNREILVRNSCRAISAVMGAAESVMSVSLDSR